MAHEIPPVIRRAWSQDDSAAEVLHTVEEDTTFHRGFGTTGRVVEHVAHDCPCCSHDEMIRQVRRNPEDRDDVLYWCLMPNCRYFVSDELGWATKPYPQYTPDSPMVWDNTAECPDCGTRHTVTVHRNSRLHEQADAGNSCIIEQVCDDCEQDDEPFCRRDKLAIPEAERVEISETTLDVPGLPDGWSWTTANRYSNNKTNLFFGFNSGEPGGWLGEIDNFVRNDGEEYWSVHIRQIKDDGTETGIPAEEPEVVEEFQRLDDAITRVPDMIEYEVDA